MRNVVVSKNLEADSNERHWVCAQRCSTAQLQGRVSVGRSAVRMAHCHRLSPPETVSQAAWSPQHTVDSQREQQRVTTPPSVPLARGLSFVAGTPLRRRPVSVWVQELP